MPSHIKKIRNKKLLTNFNLEKITASKKSISKSCRSSTTSPEVEDVGEKSRRNIREKARVQKINGLVDKLQSVVWRECVRDSHQRRPRRLVLHYAAKYISLLRASLSEQLPGGIEADLAAYVTDGKQHPSGGNNEEAAKRLRRLLQEFSDSSSELASDEDTLGQNTSPESSS